jgi:hypothetical protein
VCFAAGPAKLLIVAAFTPVEGDVLARKSELQQAALTILVANIVYLRAGGLAA